MCKDSSQFPGCSNFSGWCIVSQPVIPPAVYIKHWVFSLATLLISVTILLVARVGDCCHNHRGYEVEWLTGVWSRQLSICLSVCLSVCTHFFIIMFVFGIICKYAFTPLLLCDYARHVNKIGSDGQMNFAFLLAGTFFSTEFVYKQ